MGVTVNKEDFQSGTRAGSSDGALAYVLFRLTLGTDFLFHSATRWAHIGQFADKTVVEFASTPLPPWSVRWYAIVITVLEPIIGLLLVLGFRTREALIAGALLITTLVFGTALRGDFTVLSKQLIYSLLFFLLLLYREAFDRWSVDRLRERKLDGAKR